MNSESNFNRHIEVARTEDEMYNRLEALKSQGYEETDIHVISKDHSQISTLSRYSNVATHEAGTFSDKFKSWFTGEDAVTEGLRPLNLTESEREKYSGEVARGSFVLYTDHAPTGNGGVGTEEYDTFGATGNSYESYSGDNQPLETTGAGIDNRVQTKDTQMTATAGTEFVESRFTESETNGLNDTTTFGAEEPSNVNKRESKQDEPETEYAKEHGFEKSTNEFVNETDGKYDEPVDRFARGESFTTDPILARDTDHIGTSMQEKETVQQHRPTSSERNQHEEKVDMDTDRDRDTNTNVTSKLNDTEVDYNRTNTNEPITDAYKTEGFQSPGSDPNLGPAAFGDEEENKFTTEKNVKHDFDKDPRNTELNYRSTDNENQRNLDSSLNEDEDITTDQYKERIDKDKYRGDNASINKLF